MVAWIGRGGLKAWPPRSPDLILLEFSVWEYVKDKVFVQPLPASFEELLARITEAIATTDADMIYWLWDEIAYRWDISCVTRGNHSGNL